MIMEADRPERRVIVITEVSRGLGKAMAREFAEQGHLVAGCGRQSLHPQRDGALADLRQGI